jgi:hypothetical protein
MPCGFQKLLLSVLSITFMLGDKSATVIQNWQTRQDIKHEHCLPTLHSQSCPSGRITCSYLASAQHVSDTKIALLYARTMNLEIKLVMFWGIQKLENLTILEQ